MEGQEMRLVETSDGNIMVETVELEDSQITPETSFEQVCDLVRRAWLQFPSKIVIEVDQYVKISRPVNAKDLLINNPDIIKDNMDTIKEILASLPEEADAPIIKQDKEESTEVSGKE